MPYSADDRADAADALARVAENAMGVSAYAEYMQKEKPTSNSRQQEVLKRVRNVIVVHAGDTGFAWEFNVFINAWSLSGRKIAVYAALMKKFNMNIMW